MILTCDRRYNTFDIKKIIKHSIEDLIFKPSKIKKKTLKLIKVVKNNQNFVKKMFLLLKYQNLLTFLVKNTKKLSCFSWCFYMESPKYLSFATL